jgi:hypothetical protein
MARFQNHLKIGNKPMKGTAIAQYIEFSIRYQLSPPYKQKTYFYKKRTVFLDGLSVVLRLSSFFRLS